MSERHHSLVFHSLHRRHVRGGCLPVFLLLSVAVLAGVFMLVRVEMKPPLRPAGEGNLLYRKDELLETQIRQRSPLPLRLPRYVAPLRQDEGVVNMPLRRTLNAATPPEELPYPTAPDSVVLNPTTLLELPPVKDAGMKKSETQAPAEPAPAPAPTEADAPLNPEPTSAARPGKEVA